MTQETAMGTMGDPDPAETSDWIDALRAVQQHRGGDRSNFIINRLVDQGRRDGVYVPSSLNTAYCNTIPPEREAIMRWNALAMVARANEAHGELGGHIASYASAAEIFEVGFNHFFRGSADGQRSDLVYFQPHSAPGVYSRAFLEGRLSEQQLGNYRQEVDGPGLCSYPHPWLMPDFWQFPTGSMGLGR
jgi:pyruvate dehydrogenase E1 component